MGKLQAQNMPMLLRWLRKGVLQLLAQNGSKAEDSGYFDQIHFADCVTDLA